MLNKSGAGTAEHDSSQTFSLDAKVIKLVMKLSEIYYLKSYSLGIFLSNTFDNVIRITVTSRLTPKPFGS